MIRSPLRALSLVACAAILSCAGLALTTPGCELAVQLDRSFADGGDDAGCAICSDAGDLTDDAGDDDGAVDATVDAASTVDAAPDAPLDSAVEAGGG